jgi:hypothetical protein
MTLIGSMSPRVRALILGAIGVVIAAAACIS